MQSKDFRDGHAVGVLVVDCPMCFSPSFYLESFVQSFLVTHNFWVACGETKLDFVVSLSFYKRKKEKRCIEC
jgi:hypothetical protein